VALNINDNKGVGIIHITGTTSTPQTIFSELRYIDMIIWNGGTAGGHKVHILTGNDKPFLGFTFFAVNQSERIKIGRDINGMKIDDLDSGELFIYFRPRTQ